MMDMFMDRNRSHMPYLPEKKFGTAPVNKIRVLNCLPLSF